MRHAKILAVTALLPFMLIGCMRARTAPTPPAIVPVPQISAEPKPAPEPTLLENYQHSIRQLDAERSRADQLQTELTKEREIRRAAQEEAAALQTRVADLEKRTVELAELRTKYETSQQTALDMEIEMRKLRDDLLQARLTGTKTEQALLAMKIEKAMENRRRVLQNNQEGADKNVPEVQKELVTP